MQPDNEQGSWAYKGEDESNEAYSSNDPYQLPQRNSDPVTWTASEFINHHKDIGWFAMIAGGFVLFSALLYLITRDLLSVIFIGVAVILFMIIGAKKPQQRTYSVDNRGISIDRKFYPYEMFKSFTLANEGAFNSLVFMPLKRFMPELTIYFAPNDEARIIDVIANSLPNEQRREKSVDQLMKRLRF